MPPEPVVLSSYGQRLDGAGGGGGDDCSVIGTGFQGRVVSYVRGVARTSTRGRRFRWSAVGVVVVLLAAVLVPVGGVGAQQKVGPSPVLGPSGGSTAPVAVAGNGQVTLSWSAPTDDGGSPIVGYEYTYAAGASGSEVDRGVWYPIPGSTRSTTSYTVTGLQNGQSHRFKLRAVNAAGQKGSSEDAYRSNQVFPTTVPQAPGGLRATPGDLKITLNWTLRDTVSREAGWTLITRYDYQQKTGDGDWTPWGVITASNQFSNEFEVTGLTNGVTYRFRLRAVNVNGAGPSTETGPVVASGTPGRPQNVRATPGDGSVTLSWSASGDGGSPIIGWEYRGQDDSKGGLRLSDPWTRITGSGASTTSYVVTGLDNTKDYFFQVRAVNANGAGTPSPETTVVHLGSVPGAIPTGAPAAESEWFRQRPGEDSITFLWAKPNNGGSPLIRYEYQQKAGDGEWGQWMTIPADRTFATSSGGGTYLEAEISTDLADVSSTNARAYTVPGLAAGTPYRFRIRAVNRIGAGPYVETPKDLYPGTVGKLHR